jgi:hypothetical protein
MRLGYVIGTRRGGVDALLAEAAGRLQAEGRDLAGVVQINPEVPGRRCDMDLILLGEAERFRISQCLGPQARGCRLDPAGLEAAVGRVEAGLALRAPELLIVNKFGKAEIGGRGFRPVIARALGDGVPVLVGVNRANLNGFQDFAGGVGTPLPEDLGAVLDWCRGVARDAA